ncbi:MAG: purine-binding chemotaxis protein CheW [Nevskia sp.]|nr:purine-binding chemotaxis protein CheW [Nevskia sp.]
MSAVNPTAIAAELQALTGQPFELLYALENRLRAARLDIAAGQTQSWTGLAFRLGERWLVAPREDVREVITPPKVTRIPGAKPWLLGVANVRGNLLPVTDLGQMLGQAREPEHRDQRVLVFNSDRVPAGVLVDEVAGYRQFAPSDQRHELARGQGPLEPYLLGGFAREGRNWLVLSLYKLTSAQAFVVAGA